MVGTDFYISAYPHPQYIGSSPASISNLFYVGYYLTFCEPILIRPQARRPSFPRPSSYSISCCIHPRKHNRIVVDCFYFTQAITLCLLVYFNNNLQCLRASPSTPVITIGSNDSQYMNVAVPILKLFTSITACYVSIIVSLLYLVITFWLNC